MTQCGSADTIQEAKTKGVDRLDVRVGGRGGGDLVACPSRSNTDYASLSRRRRRVPGDRKMSRSLENTDSSRAKGRNERDRFEV